MGIITAGQVKNGVIVPNIPLPERAWCRIEVQDVPVEVEPELQEEFDAWDRASAETMDTVDRLLEEDDADGKG
jgi:hypothetical protein